MTFRWDITHSALFIRPQNDEECDILRQIMESGTIPHDILNSDFFVFDGFLQEYSSIVDDRPIFHDVDGGFTSEEKEALCARFTECLEDVEIHDHEETLRCLNLKPTEGFYSEEDYRWGFHELQAMDGYPFYVYKGNLFYVCVFFFCRVCKFYT